MKVLLAVDGSSYTRRMLEYLANRPGWLGSGTQYTAITVVPEIPPHPRSYIAANTLDEYYKEEADKVLEPALAVASEHGWSFDVLRKIGRPGDVIAETASTGGYDLIVMGSHGHTSLGSLVIGSTVTRVLARCKVPVLIVR